MEILLHSILIVAVLGFVLSLVLPRRAEHLISLNANISVGLHLSGLVAMIALWFIQGLPQVDIKEFVLYSTEGYEYYIAFHFDEISAVYAVVGSFLTLLVTLYSRVYLHRERGFKRFFNTIQFFFIGYNLIIFAGNLETLFIGWEVLGISSFLLIAFYRDRYLPVRNAVKVYSIYRLGDIGLILAMWMIHHLFHENIMFNALADVDKVNEHLETHSWVGVSISLLLLLAAMVKSAQLPFSAWLPRAMEGPTPSSAIFYGSLSVHLGVFLLMRTFPFWEHQLSVRIVIGMVGLLTSLVASGIARVQSSVKSQIAYASVAQIGIIFVEVALGLKWLALLHFAGNAFLRTYQLLVSPSVVSYLIREQFYNFQPRPTTVEDSFPKRIQYSLYLLCLKEWNLDTAMHQIYRAPIKKFGRYLRFLSPVAMLGLGLPLYGMGLALRLYEVHLPAVVQPILAPFFAAIALMVVVRAYVERKQSMYAWWLVVSAHFWLALAVSFNERFDVRHVFVYLLGVALSSMVGFVCLRMLSRDRGAISLDQYQGYSYSYPRLSTVFLLACLGVTGFPITPTFIGEDLIFSHIHEDQIPLAAITALTLIIDGLAVVRIFAKVFNGPQVHGDHATAYKSS